MRKVEFQQEIKDDFAFAPTHQQDLAIQMLSDFMSVSVNQCLFILKGYAGTGKTSLISSFVKVLRKHNYQVILLAPTGRAARVLSNYSEIPALTIHRKIYRQHRVGDIHTNYSLNTNLHAHTLFIVDEASMISHKSSMSDIFSSNPLLDDLIEYVYSGNDCRLMLIGDTAQLPPIGENESKALNAEYLQGFGLDTFEIELNEVVRQRAESGILLQATHIRQYITAIQKQMYEYGQTEEIKQPLIPAKPFPDLQCVEGEELLEALEDSYSQVGIEDTIIITRANWRANQYNMGIRNRILWREELLERGDLLMVAKNNYYWAEQDKRDDFLANGEIIQVRKVIKRYKLYGFEWAQVELEVPDHEEWYPEVLLLVDTLLAEAPALTKEQQEKLYYAILEDYQHITTQKARLKALKEDKHFNALQVKYAYAITCHKSQGGQWRRVFLDGAMLQEDMLNLDGLRWLYTAYTRATDKLYLINYPERGKETAPIRSNEGNV